jgi:hypothetical protein
MGGDGVVRSVARVTSDVLASTPLRGDNATTTFRLTLDVAGAWGDIEFSGGTC